MRFRLIRQSIDHRPGGILSGTSSWYILQVKENEQDEYWQTVPIHNWDDLSDSDRAEIVRALQPKGEKNGIRS